MSGWYVGAVIHKVEAGIHYFLVRTSRSIDYRYAHLHPQVKFLGGTNKGHSEDKSTFSTLVREVFEESGLRVKAETQSMFLCHYPANRVSGIEKYFFLVEYDSCEGELRDEEMLDGNDVLSPPYWLEAGESGDTVYRTHQGALLRALKYYNLVG